MKHFKSLRLFCSCVLTAIVVAGCGQKPAGNLEISSTNTPSSSVATRTSAGITAASATVSNSIPLRTILSLKKEGLAGAGGAMVRIRGTVLDEQPGEYIVVHDKTDTILAETHQAVLPKIKEQVDLEGQPVSDGDSVSLKNAVATPLATGGSTNIEASALLVKPAELPLLTNVWQIRDLPAERAAWHYPVRLRAVITVNAHFQDYVFVQDNSAGISVLMEGISTNLNPGDLVEIEGASDPGNFSPIVLASNVTVLGSAPLPEAKQETLFQLATGQYGSQWIEVRGVVRSMSWSNGMAQLNLRDLDGTIPVNIPAEREPVQLLDAIVRIRGACGSGSNDKRQFKGFTMWASSLDEVKVEEPGALDPLSLPAQPIASLDQFHPSETLQHRVTVAGIVTCVHPSGSAFFFLQDVDAGVKVEVPSTGDLKAGDYVFASGYPGLGGFGDVLQNAIFKVIGHRQMPPPDKLVQKETLDPFLHDRWVQADARFLHHSKIGDEDVLTLQIGSRIFDARITSPTSARIQQLQPDSLLQVTGNYRVLSDEAHVPKSFQLAVPTESEIQILEEPSWWTVEHALTVIGLMAAGIGAAILWVLMLRRKVRQQTASLKQSERQFRTLVEQSLVGVYIIQNERFIYVNPRLAAIFGYTPEEMMTSDKIMTEVVHPEDLPLVLKQIRRRIDTETATAHYSFRGRRKDGSTIDVEVLGNRTEFGGKPAVLGTLLDITESKLAQDKITEQARMLDLASDAIIVSDLEDRILYWNQSAHRIYGWTAQEAVGGIAFEKMRVNPAEFQKARQALLQNHQWHGEFTHADPHGGEIIVETRWTLVHDAQGKPGSILAINTDITHSKKLEAQFLRSQRLDSIGVLAGGIAHDLNNVLAPILMSGRLLEMDPDAPDRGEMIANILNSTQRAADLVRQILTFARGTDGRHTTVQPCRLLEELRKLLNETLPKSIHLQIHNTPDVRTIAVNATQIHQVLMNLCINARDAMPNGGELTVSVADVELDEHDAATNGNIRPGSYVVFSVTDNGTGISPEIRDRIFDPFFTTKSVGKGTGLGLSIATGIIKSHGGCINVESSPNHGSCFNVYLPAHHAVQHDAVQGRTAGLVRGNNELILVVDDEAPIRNITRQTLNIFGYRAITAGNGAEAVACYSRQKDEIALVVVDMMMPVMDGPATIRALVQINPEIKIIAASGLTSEGQINSPTIRAFLPKPYSADKMLAAIHEVLHPNVANQEPAG
jgi:PAS domain S-box-containing protein